MSRGVILHPQVRPCLGLRFNKRFTNNGFHFNDVGFDDAIRSLDKLTAIKFDLPTDLAVRQLSNITEAF